MSQKQRKLHFNNPTPFVAEIVGHCNVGPKVNLGRLISEFIY